MIKKVLNGMMFLLLVLSMGAYKKASTDVIEAKGQIVSLKSANANLVYEIQNQDVKAINELAEEIYGIEAELLEAIQILETGHYTSTLYKTHNNTWGAMNGNEYKYFDSHEQSTLELARCLKYYYLDEGLTTLTQIGEKYCPEDPSWSEKVNQIYLELMG